MFYLFKMSQNPDLILCDVITLFDVKKYPIMYIWDLFLWYLVVVLFLHMIGWITKRWGRVKIHLHDKVLLQLFYYFVRCIMWTSCQFEWFGRVLKSEIKSVWCSGVCFAIMKGSLDISVSACHTHSLGS